MVQWTVVRLWTVKQRSVGSSEAEVSRTGSGQQRSVRQFGSSEQRSVGKCIAAREWAFPCGQPPPTTMQS